MHICIPVFMQVSILLLPTSTPLTIVMANDNNNYQLTSQIHARQPSEKRAEKIQYDQLGQLVCYYNLLFPNGCYVNTPVIILHL